MFILVQETLFSRVVLTMTPLANTRGMSRDAKMGTEEEAEG